MTETAQNAGATRLIAGSALRGSVRDHTVSLLAGLFLLLVLVSAYLGWSATNTVNAIYLQAADMFRTRGAEVPINPVTDTSPLSLLRNMATYVALIGALSALMLGHRSVAVDRKAGVLPLLASRPFGLRDYALGKLAGTAAAIVGVLALAASVSAVTLLLLPGLTLSADEWMNLAAFFGVSAVYMLAFGMLGILFAMLMRSESVALLVPVLIWLTVSFVVPQLTSNINPMAALNPLSANAAPPDDAFFHWMSAVLGPLSLVESYRVVAASLLDYLPPDLPHTNLGVAMASLLMADAVLLVCILFAVKRMDFCSGDFNE